MYLHVLSWPDGDLVLPALPAKVVGVSALTGGEVLLTQDAESLEISMDASARDEIDTIIVLDLDCAVEGTIPTEVSSN